ncbi:hypothetical protein [Verrucomicrobium sp. BvORR106]|uniref:hypothetical protein n=1 Tax=Verrucomicrobium sp. BvORR106 TaxID=1403819 RepID=UPI000572044D|nr:hypothetical protein [Verrucomicrobium sp. BvORR106]
MLPRILLPRWFKWLGVLLYVGTFIYVAVTLPPMDDLTSGVGLLVQCLCMAGLLFITCAREKVEDEWIARLRLTSLQWAVVVLIVVRMSVKTYAWARQDPSVDVGYQTNFMLLVYALVFHSQLYGWRLYAWWKGREGADE